MCRIGGLWYRKGPIPLPALLSRLQEMASLQMHGGPDGEGVWLHPEKCLGFAHRRLAIIDLSPAGAQPMQKGSLVITYNGEIYNYKELRTVLEKRGYTFSSTSDTEVLLWGWKEWGPDLLPRLRGMWAFALWDGESLWLVRDRFGVKPLFYFLSDALLAFASELPALLAVLPASPSPFLPALPMYLSYGFIRNPYTFYEGVLQVRPGGYLHISEKGAKERPYWDPLQVFFPEKKVTYSTEEVEAQLLSSFERRLIADVPVGLFLSGGIDSSLVAALLSVKTQTFLPTFTLGFDENSYDESFWAARIAAHLHLPHFSTRISLSELIPLVEKIPLLYGQPFGDASALAVYALAQFASQQVKVVLSADGGDELFGGYVRHTQSISWLRAAGRILRTFPWSGRHLAKLPLFKNRFHNLSAKLLKLSHFHGHHYGEMVQAFPESLISSYFTEPISSLVYIDEPLPEPWYSLGSRQYADLRIYLSDDVLQKVDRATMAHALEAREPFLDPELVELAGRLPALAKVQGTVTKRILREILHRYIPSPLWKRPKQGFAIPVAAWLRNPLAERLRYYVYSEESPLRFLPLDLEKLRATHRHLEEGEEGLGLLFWHLLVLGLWGDWYPTKSLKADSLSQAKGESA